MNLKPNLPPPHLLLYGLQLRMVFTFLNSGKNLKKKCLVACENCMKYNLQIKCRGTYQCLFVYILSRAALVLPQ